MFGLGHTGSSQGIRSYYKDFLTTVVRGLSFSEAVQV